MSPKSLKYKSNIYRITLQFQFANWPEVNCANTFTSLLLKKLEVGKKLRASNTARFPTAISRKKEIMQYFTLALTGHCTHIDYDGLMLCRI